MNDPVTPAAAALGAGSRPSPGEWRAFWRTPLPLRLHVLSMGALALVLPFVLHRYAEVDSVHPEWLTAAMLMLVSVLNVEISRLMTGGLEHQHQPHKALSAWAFASAMLLPAPWLLVVVPVTYAHARWRGLRLPLWKWVGSGCYLVLAGVAAATIRHAVFEQGNWMDANGGHGVLALVLAGLTFLAAEALLFAGSAVFNRAEDEVWLRRTLTSLSFYSTEAGVLLMGGLLCAVWTGGAWFVLLFLPVYVLIQRAALHEPLRERAEAATQLAMKNDELEQTNKFKIDLIGMLGHEIGNPLTSISGYAQLAPEAMERGDLDFLRKAFDVVDRNAAQIERVLREILMLVSSERGALVAHPEPCLIAPHLQAAAMSHRVGPEPEIDCPTGLVATVQPGHLDQILANLVSNADKYAGGATSISAEVAADGRIEVTVADAGPGVPPAFRAHLFERFSRDAGTAQKVMGTGLGLFITRELARANHGDIELRDRPSGGSAFVLLLPAQ